MSRHCNPESELARVSGSSPRPRWPDGATAGVALVAVGCVGMALLLYRLAAPRDVFGA